MAEVLVSTQTISNIMLHSPPDPFHSSSGQSHHNSSRGAQAPRSYSNHNVPYRSTSSTPVAPYAFQSTPSLRQDLRPTSNPVQRQSVGPTSLAANRNAYSPTSSASNASSTNSASNASSTGAQNYTVSKDDSVLIGQRGSRPSSTFLTSNSTPDLSLVSFDNTPKPSPDRYRRVQRRVDNSASISNSQQTLESQPFSPALGTQSSLHAGGQKATPFRGPAGLMHIRTASSDDVHLKQNGRYRRRSVGSMEAVSAPVPSPVTMAAPTWSQVAARGHAAQVAPVVPVNTLRPISQHQRHDSNESKSSASSAGAKRPSSARHDSSPHRTGVNSTQRPKTAPSQSQRTSSRTNTSDASKRLTSPSPLSQPMSSDSDRTAQKLTNVRPATSAGTIHATNALPSPAVQQLHALSERDPNKGMKSRLRRAFSFGSAQELRKASAENAGRAKLQKERYAENLSEEHGLEGEDAAIAAQQEAGGLGAGIYSGQGVIYGSTDNLSISSTASSASIMLRKMGRGAKKSARSIKGLFRPKSVIGDPAADSAVSQPTIASTEVSLVTVEAEREKVNVNVDPHDQPGGGTGFPHLEHNSIDNASTAALERPTSSRHVQQDSTSSRKSIVGGDRERQEVLAAVKKGILKRSNTASPVGSRQESIPTDMNSIPGTPDDQTLAGNLERDYFIATARFANSSTRSLPDRPDHASIRSISWNPKVSFHDVFSPNEYDRRGDIATCNRLTPVLAQQIKEELNSFKMEMEVHEESKPHTHFF